MYVSILVKISTHSLSYIQTHKYMHKNNKFTLLTHRHIRLPTKSPELVVLLSKNQTSEGEHVPASRQF